MGLISDSAKKGLARAPHRSCSGHRLHRPRDRAALGGGGLRGERGHTRTHHLQQVADAVRGRAHGGDPMSSGSSASATASHGAARHTTRPRARSR